MVVNYLLIRSEGEKFISTNVLTLIRRPVDKAVLHLMFSPIFLENEFFYSGAYLAVKVYPEYRVNHNSRNRIKKH